MNPLFPPALKSYLDADNKLGSLPGRKQKKKLDLIIDYLSTQFQAGTVYSEAEVNAILNRHHSFKDPATLRRLLYGTGKLDRTKDGTKYWVNKN